MKKLASTKKAVNSRYPSSSCKNQKHRYAATLSLQLRSYKKNFRGHRLSAGQARIHSLLFLELLMKKILDEGSTIDSKKKLGRSSTSGAQQVNTVRALRVLPFLRTKTQMVRQKIGKRKIA